jgi:hypothetical protein
MIQFRLFFSRGRVVHMCDVVQGVYDHELSITVETGAAALD